MTDDQSFASILSAYHRDRDEDVDFHSEQSSSEDEGERCEVAGILSAVNSSSESSFDVGEKSATLFCALDEHNHDLDAVELLFQPKLRIESILAAQYPSQFDLGLDEVGDAGSEDTDAASSIGTLSSVPLHQAQDDPTHSLPTVTNEPSTDSYLPSPDPASQTPSSPTASSSSTPLSSYPTPLTASPSSSQPDSGSDTLASTPPSQRYSNILPIPTTPDFEMRIIKSLADFRFHSYPSTYHLIDLPPLALANTSDTGSMSGILNLGGGGVNGFRSDAKTINMKSKAGAGVSVRRWVRRSGEMGRRLGRRLTSGRKH